VTVVLLPLVPVMATYGQGESTAPSSISPMTGTPASSASFKSGAVRGMPGLVTMSS